MVVVPIQVQVRLKDDFTIPVNTEPTSAILVRNHWIFFKDMKKALEFLMPWVMDVADTKPDHKAFAGTVAGNGTSNENKIRNWAKRGRNY